jgi:hypothetical protein
MLVKKCTDGKADSLDDESITDSHNISFLGPCIWQISSCPELMTGRSVRKVDHTCYVLPQHISTPDRQMSKENTITGVSTERDASVS